MMGFIKKRKGAAASLAAASLVVSGLAVGSTVSTTMSAFSDSAKAEVSGTTGSWIVPSSSLVATDDNFLNINVTWAAVPGYPNYELQYRTSRFSVDWSSTAAITSITVNGATSYTLSNAATNATYYFRVRPTPAVSTVAGGWTDGTESGRQLPTWDPAKVGDGWDMYSSISGYGDADGNGTMDMMAIDSSGNLFMYPNSGDAVGTFQTRRASGSGWTGRSLFTSGYGFDPNNKPGMDWHDNATGNYYRSTNWTTNGFTKTDKVGSGWAALRSVTQIGDVNNDGKTDILAISGNTQYRVYYGGVPIIPGVTVAADWSKYSSLIHVGDVNGDGRPDVLGVDSTKPMGSENVWFIPGINNSSIAYGYFNPAAAVLVPKLAVDSRDTFIGNGDSNGDGVSDFYETDLTGTGARYPAKGYQLFWNGSELKRSLSTVINVPGYTNGVKDSKPK